MARKLQNFGYLLAGEESAPGSGVKAGDVALADADAVYAEDIMLSETHESIQRRGASVYPPGWKSAPATVTPTGRAVFELSAFPIAHFGAFGSHARPPIHPALVALGFNVVEETEYEEGVSNPSLVYGLDPLAAGTSVFEFRTRIEGTDDEFLDVTMKGAVADGSITCSTSDRVLVNLSNIVGTSLVREDEQTHENFAPSYADGGVQDDGAAANEGLSTHRVPLVGLNAAFTLTFVRADGSEVEYDGDGINGLTLDIRNNVQTPRTMSSSGGVAAAIRVPNEPVGISFTLDPTNLGEFDPYALTEAKTTGFLALTLSDAEDARHKVRFDLPFTIDSITDEYAESRMVYNISGAVVYTDQAAPDQPLRITFFTDYEETGAP